VDTGIVFRRTDLAGTPEVAAHVSNVAGTDLGTTLAQGEAKVHTVEHLLAALVAREVDNAFVELDAAELPGRRRERPRLRPLLAECGVEEQDAPPASWRWTRPSRWPRADPSTWSRPRRSTG
jgi:UDP-3-O-acyl-N-acetylglucosamine deacetylase